MWDLMRGKGSASTKLGKGVSSVDIDLVLLLTYKTEGEVVRWSTDGTHFVVLSQLTIDLYTTVRLLIT